jgi:hypothetical protein
MTHTEFVRRYIQGDITFFVGLKGSRPKKSLDGLSRTLADMVLYNLCIPIDHIPQQTYGYHFKENVSTWNLMARERCLCFTLV